MEFIIDIWNGITSVFGWVFQAIIAIIGWITEIIIALFK